MDAESRRQNCNPNPHQPPASGVLIGQVEEALPLKCRRIDSGGPMRWIAMTSVLLSCTMGVGVGAARQAGAPKGKTRTTAEIAARARRAVVTIATTNAVGGALAIGSGFVVKADGVIVTNWHVLDGAAAATVTLTSGEVFRHVTFLDGDPTIDVAILKVAGSKLPTLDMTSEVPAVGSRVVAVGSPLGLNDTVSEGIVSAVRVARGRELVQTTTPIAHGSSGGPLINPQGLVFAISTFMLDGAPLINFGVPAKYAMQFVRDGLAERALPEVFHPEPAAPSRAMASAPDTPLGRTDRPRADLSGIYFLQPDGPVENAQRLLLVAGKDVGLLRLEHEVVPVNVLRTDESGEVAFAVGDDAYSGYQTGKGFVYFPTGSGDPMVAARISQPLASNIGLYVVTSRIASGPTDARRVVDWAGEAAVIADKQNVAISLRISSPEGQSRAFSANGTVDEHGRFRMTTPGGSFDGTITAGVIHADWCSRGEDGTDVCVPVQARRR
jgi:S1-C subfamily serine protease